jgi:hypothetical protein
MVEAAIEQGWTYDTTADGHPRLNPPRGLRGRDGSLVMPVAFASSPSDIRGDRNSRSRLRRAGVEGI